MRTNQSVVCLLVLAGSACIFLAARLTRPGSPHPPVTARNLARRETQRPPARSVFKREAAPRISRFNSGASANSDGASPNRGLAKFSIPVTFEQNVGQAGEGVQFLGRGKGLTVALMRDEIAVQVARPASRESGTLALRVVGSAGFQWKGKSKLRAESNYFVGNDKRKWHTSVPHFARAEAADAGPGVGIAVYGSDDGVEYDLRVAPGKDVSKLRLRLTGAENLRVNADGDLLMNVSGDEVRMKKPRVYEAPHAGWHSSGSRHRGSLGSRRAKNIHRIRRSERDAHD